MAAQDVTDWISYPAATTIYKYTVVAASIAGTTQEVKNTTASTDRPIGVCMVTASHQGKPCSISQSGVVLILCQSTAGTLGVPVVCCATAGQVRTTGLAPATGATGRAIVVGYLAESFSSNTAGDPVKVRLSIGRG
jgi:hypothetical protein